MPPKADILPCPIPFPIPMAARYRYRYRYRDRYRTPGERVISVRGTSPDVPGTMDSPNETVRDHSIAIAIPIAIAIIASLKPGRAVSIDDLHCNLVIPIN
jgi:hypothetical protein